MSLNKRSRVGLVAAAACSALIAGSIMPAVFAGTGGSDHAGVIFGEDGNYCDAQGVNVLKVDSQTGVPLDGAVFEVVNNGSQVLGFKEYSSDLAEAQVTDPGSQLVLDRILWQEEFDQQVDNYFMQKSLGTAWLNAAIKMDEDQDQTDKFNKDDDATVRDYDDNVIYFPADIRGVGTASRNAAMQAWVLMVAQADDPDTTPVETTTSVIDFGSQVKERLDAIGNVVYSDYDAASGTGTTVRPEVADTDSIDMLEDAFNQSSDEWAEYLAAVTATGNVATWSGSVVSIDADDFDADNQDWDAFVTAYTAMTAPGAFAFGIAPPTYDVIANEIGLEDLEAAIEAANDLIGAETILAAGDTENVTANEGNIWIGVFGRNIGTTGTGTLDKSCIVQDLTIQEITAPEGYRIDDGAPRSVVFSNTEDEVVDVTFTDTLLTVPVDPDKPTPPKFESGI